MAKSIENIVSFPVNAQRNSFFGALSSILLYRNRSGHRNKVARVGMLLEHFSTYV